MADPINDAVTQSRVKLLFKHPFYGNLATRLAVVDATGWDWCKTVSTDGRNLYFDREFVKSLTSDELQFVICHEIVHLAMDHINRAKGKDKQVYAMAADYVTNYMLKKDGVGKMPSTALYDERFTDEMSSEEVYEILMENSVEIKEPLDQHLDLDDASDGEGDDNGQGDGEGNGQLSARIVGGPDGPPKLTKEDQDRIRNEMKAAMLSAAQSVGAGKVPAGFKRLIGDLTQPIMDWRAMLEDHMKSAVKGDFTFNRPSKRSWTLGRGHYVQSHRVILPGQDFENTVDAAVAIDTSGSMTDEMLRDILSEVKGIMEEFQDFRLTIWTFDTRVYNPQVFTPANVEEILTYDPQGGGGTDFEVNWHFMKDTSRFNNDDLPDELIPEKLVFFTDGYPGGEWCPPGDEDYCDTLFIVHGSKSIVAPFGMTAYYDEAKKN